MTIEHNILSRQPDYIHVKCFDLINLTEYQYSRYDVKNKGITYVARFNIKYK